MWFSQKKPDFLFSQDTDIIMSVHSGYRFQSSLQKLMKTKSLIAAAFVAILGTSCAKFLETRVKPGTTITQYSEGKEINRWTNIKHLEIVGENIRFRNENGVYIAIGGVWKIEEPVSKPLQVTVR